MIDKCKELAAYARSIRSRIIATILLAVFCAGTVFAAATASYTVTVVDDGQARSVITTRSDANAILGQAKVEIGADDKVDLSAFISGEDSTITIYRAKNVTVSDGEAFSKSIVAAGTVADAVAKSGMTLKQSDVLNFPKDTLLKEGMSISIQIAFPVQITADGKTTAVEVVGGTVEDAIRAAGISMDEDDESTPAKDQPVTDGMEIRVDRVDYQLRTEKETIAFKKLTEKSVSMYTDQRKVVQKGENGKKEVTYKDRYVNGKLVKTTVDSEKVLKAAVNQKTLVGTLRRVNKIKLKNGLTPISDLKVPSYVKLDQNGVPTKYKKVVDGKAAAYSGGWGTASGRKAMPGHIAVDPKQFPYGTEMWIVSTDGKYVYGYAIAADTGGFVQQKTFTVDLYMHSYEEACRWGARQVRIYVL